MALGIVRLRNTSNSDPIHLGIHFKGKHDFWSAVPSCSDIFRHQAHFFAPRDAGLNTSGQTKIANFKVTIRIEEKVGGLQITMDDICAVN